MRRLLTLLLVLGLAGLAVGDSITYVGVAGGGAGGTWGSITGTLSSQTDLQTEIDTKMEEPSSNGVAVRTGNDTSVARTITSSDGSVVWTNGDGVAGNPSGVVDNAVFRRYTSGTTGPPGTCSVGVGHFETDTNDAFECPSPNVQIELAEKAGNVFTGTHDFSGATAVMVPKGSAAPASAACDATGEVGSLYIQSGDPASVNLQIFRCTQTGASTYAWHPISHQAGTTPPATCSVAAVFFDTDATVGQNWYGCTSAGVWTLLGDGGGGSAEVVPRPNTKRWFYCTVSAGGVLCSGVRGFFDGTATDIDPTASDGFFGDLLTTTGPDTHALLSTNGLSIRLGRNLYLETYAKLEDTTSQRTFIGFQTDYRSPSSDDPAIHVAAFRCSSAASDANWKCVTNDATGGGTINDSGVACNTTSREFAIVENPGTSYVFKIDGSTVCTNTTNLPTSGTNVYMSVALRTLAASTRNFRVGYAYVEMDR